MTVGKGKPAGATMVTGRNIKPRRLVRITNEITVINPKRVLIKKNPPLSRGINSGLLAIFAEKPASHCITHGIVPTADRIHPAIHGHAPDGGRAIQGLAVCGTFVNGEA